MYNSERFLETVARYLKIKISKESLGQVKDIVERSSINGRVMERMRLRSKLFQMYEGMCQVCASEVAGINPSILQVAYIKPFRAGGEINTDNLLLLCPNHHALFEKGSFSIAQDFSLIGLEGSLLVHPAHAIDPSCLAFHRDQVYTGMFAKQLNFGDIEPIRVKPNPYPGPKKS